MHKMISKKRRRKKKQRRKKEKLLGGLELFNSSIAGEFCVFTYNFFFTLFFL